MVRKFSQTEMNLAGASLEALNAIDDILEGSTERATEAKASPSALYAYATDPNYTPSENLLRLLTNDTDTRSNFQLLLKNTSAFVLPQVAAASTGEITTREIEGCKIDFRSSHADTGQLYVIIEITHRERMPGMLFIRQPDGETHRITLPDFQDNRAQLLLERNSAEARGLMDINTEVYLR